MEAPLKLPKLNNRGKEDKEVLRPRYNPQNKTFRHRAGQLPAFYAQKDEDEKVENQKDQIQGGTVFRSDEEQDSDDELEKPTRRRKHPNFSQFLDFDKCATEGLKRRSRADGQQSQSDSADVADVAEEVDIDEAFSSSMSESDADNDDEASEPPRSRKASRPVAEEEEELGDSLFGGAEQGNDSSSSSDESDEEPAMPIIKPVFKPRAQRTVEAVPDAAEAEMKMLEENIKARQEESLRLMKEKLDAIEAKEQERSLKEQMGLTSALGGLGSGVGDNLSESGLLDDEDEMDENQAYEEWKQRELARLVRDELKRIARLKEEDETERRRLMTEEERLEDDKRIEAENEAKTVKQGKMMFMQKYYHSGAFFQNVAGSGEEKVFMKDFNAPVAEDAVDKMLLPKAMRVRRGEFGRKGRSKHTHLADVDTTDWTSPWTGNRKAPRDGQR